MGNPQTQPSNASAQSADSEPELADTLAALTAAELDAIDARRRQVLGPPLGPPTANESRELNSPRVGLALSGGGVRSATFALGLMRGLARAQDDDAPSKSLASHGLLGRLDYLSSVSGGGYTAAMYGRLVGSYGLACAQRLMAASDSPVLAWLRRNGRYLTPAGSRDLGMAVVTFLRAWIAIHAEFMVACILLGLLVIGPHLWQHTYQLLEPATWQKWHTPWWTAAAAFWVATAPGLIAGYWSARDEPDHPGTSKLRSARGVLFLLLLSAGAFYLVLLMVRDNSIHPLHQGLNWPAAGALALISMVVGQLAVRACLAVLEGLHGLKVAKLRNWLTRALRFAMLVALGLVGLGALDRLSWWVLEALLTQGDGQWIWGGVTVGSLALVALRTLMQPLQKVAADSTSQAHRWLPQLLNFTGYVGMLVLTTGWLVLLQWFVFAPEPFKMLIGVPAWLRAAVPAVLWAAWVLLTAKNAQMANTSSLHNFYRARLTRAYLAVGNRQRQFEPSPAMSAPGAAAGKHADVTQVVDGDDLHLRDYRPDQHGGPIHLVNTCLNQTRDDDSGLYNADRKGIAVTASWRGFEVGAKEFIAFKPAQDCGTLGRWVAVSGAAASPGAGAFTSRGLALLVYFLGVRLGHWMRAPREKAKALWLGRMAWRFLPKPAMLTCEASATFFGQNRPWWYLSDGGHFENSAVYPLIKRELDFIILADASGDPDYEFGDLENLVRKARIDFGADIDFYSRTEADSLFSLGSNELTVLSPEHLADNHSCRGVLLARIRYRERAGLQSAGDLASGRPAKRIRPEGTLLIVKPNLHDALDVDLLAYAQKHPSFPHESTADQSFDEAQWESYHHLGEDFGSALHDKWLAQLPGWRNKARHPLKVAARLGATHELAQVTKSEPLWRRSARAAAIGTTLGLGASGTVLISAWQFLEQQQRESATQQSALQARFINATKDLDTALESVEASCPVLKRAAITQATQMLDLRGVPNLPTIDKLTITRLVEQVENICPGQPAKTDECKAGKLAIQSLCVRLSSATETSLLNYWQPCGSPQERGTSNKAAGTPTAETSAERIKCQRAKETAKFRVPALGELPVPTNPQKPVAQDVPAAAASAPLPATAPKTEVATAASVANGTAMPAASNAAAVLEPLSLQPCLRNGMRTTLYIHIYDEPSRIYTRSLRTRLQSAGEAQVMVAPVENVSRSADLRQVRPPVAWPKPTLLLHDRNDPQAKDCAIAIKSYLGAPWVTSSDESLVWRRDLPNSLQAQPGVIELWLPPTDSISANKVPIPETLKNTGKN